MVFFTGKIVKRKSDGKLYRFMGYERNQILQRLDPAYFFMPVCRLLWLFWKSTGPQVTVTNLDDFEKRN